MAIRDYWVYQKRNVSVPWALYIVKEFDRRNYTDTVTLDYTFYHEDIPNAIHAYSYVGLHYDTIKGYADEITKEINVISTVTNQDYKQVYKAIEDIILHD